MPGTLEKVELVMVEVPREDFLVERVGPIGGSRSAWERREQLRQWVELPGLEEPMGSGFLCDGKKMEAPGRVTCVEVGWVCKIGL